MSEKPMTPDLTAAGLRKLADTQIAVPVREDGQMAPFEWVEAAKTTLRALANKMEAQQATDAEREECSKCHGQGGYYLDAANGAVWSECDCEDGTVLRAPAVAVDEGWMLFPKEAWAFLCGESALNGLHFGEQPKDAIHRPYWWRTYIRKMIFEREAALKGGA